jgi:hypothetical protein
MSCHENAKKQRFHGWTNPVLISDLDLQSEIHQTTVSRWRTGHGYTRHIYSACVDGKIQQRPWPYTKGRPWRRYVFTLEFPDIKFCLVNPGLAEGSQAISHALVGKSTTCHPLASDIRDPGIPMWPKCMPWQRHMTCMLPFS